MPDSLGRPILPAGHKVTLQQQLERRVRQLEGQLQHEHKTVELSRRELRRRAIGQETPREPEEEGWLTVYLDMMTLMLVLLVVLLAFAGKAPQNNFKDMLGEPLAPMADAPALPLPEDPLAGLDTSGLGKDIEVVVNQGSVSFRISSEIIFAPAQADLSRAGLAVLRKLVPLLLASGHRITVAGHTDAVPIRNVRYPSNWELSGARAGSVVRYLEANGIASERLTAVGHADTRPLAANASDAGRAINRRVELILEKPQP
ncbi:MAG: OmpA family protein [Pseudomonas sp.]|nr:OmpA family protein [Pseudomonas sp.]